MFVVACPRIVVPKLDICTYICNVHPTFQQQPKLMTFNNGILPFQNAQRPTFLVAILELPYDHSCAQFPSHFSAPYVLVSKFHEKLVVHVPK